MPRPSVAVLIACSTLAVFCLTSCKTIYTDTYRQKRNYFKPDKDVPKPTEMLPSTTTTTTTTETIQAAPTEVPGLEPALPAGGAAEPAPPSVPTIPGL